MKIFYATERIEVHGTPEQEAEWKRMQELADQIEIHVYENTEDQHENSQRIREQ